jgi:predicted RNA-binding protein with PIN domain
MGDVLRGIARTGLIMAATVAFGLAWAAVEARIARPAAYTGGVAAETGGPTGETWLVDGYNVLAVALHRGRARDRWWTRRAEVVALMARLDRPGTELVVVFDARVPVPAAEPPGGVREVYAPSADEWLEAAVRGAPDPARLVVVTGDRRLAARVRHRGARVVSPHDFVERCRGTAI